MLMSSRNEQPSLEIVRCDMDEQEAYFASPIVDWWIQCPYVFGIDGMNIFIKKSNLMPSPGVVHPGRDAYLTNGVFIAGLQKYCKELACANISIGEPQHHDEVQSGWRRRKEIQNADLPALTSVHFLDEICSGSCFTSGWSWVFVAGE